MALPGSQRLTRRWLRAGALDPGCGCFSFGFWVSPRFDFHGSELTAECAWVCVSEPDQALGAGQGAACPFSSPLEAWVRESRGWG